MPVGDVMNALRSISELSDQDMNRVRVAMADRYTAPPRSGDTQFWDLRLFGDGFEVLTSDPFSFRGEFLSAGLREIQASLLGPAGLEISSPWVADRQSGGFHTTVHRVAKCRGAPFGSHRRSGDARSGGGGTAGRLPSIFELTAVEKMSVRVAVAASVVDSGDPQEFQSWDLTLHGNDLQPLTCAQAHAVGSVEEALLDPGAGLERP